MMSRENWELSYKHGHTPWDTGVSQHLQQLEKIPEGRFLDICCGTGNDVAYLAKREFPSFGIDISLAALKQAKEKAEKNRVKASFVLGDILALPFKHSSFSFVNDRGCFHHVSPGDRKAFAGELRRVMKKNGLYIMKCFCWREKSVIGPQKLRKDEIMETFSQSFVVDVKEDFMDDRFEEMRKEKTAYFCRMVRK
ncbi:MAG: class I SAM-dependent methyltransferase [Candidatus Aenigmarchaeota archaeon]|nr:class I SAM-dependent methyltransferase [Candidatus Aenigmarchaeota archaeon]